MRETFLRTTLSIGLVFGCASCTPDGKTNTNSSGVESEEDQPEHDDSTGVPLPSGQILNGLVGVARSLLSNAPPDYWTGAQETHIFTYHNLLSPWSNYYSFAHDLSSTTEWHNASQIDAYAAMLQYGDEAYEPSMDATFDFMRLVWDDSISAGGYYAISAPDVSWVARDRKYVDDNALTGVAYLDAFEATGNNEYFTKAVSVAEWLIHSGLWVYEAGGGFRWNNEDTFRPTQSNGLAIQVFLRLYELTGHEEYWAWGVGIKAWLDNTLYDENERLYSWHTEDPKHIKFAYDQAIMIEVNLILYRLTGDDAFVAAAQELATNMHAKLWNRIIGGYFIHTDAENAGHRMSPTFGAWASQSLAHLYEVDGNMTWLTRARANLDFFNYYLRDRATLGYYLGCDLDGGNITYAFQSVDQAWMQRAQALLAKYD